MVNKVGGNSPKDHITRALTRTLTNSLAILSSWQGLRQNIKMSDKLFMALLKSEIQEFKMSHCKY